MKKVFSKEVVIALAVLLSLGLLYWGINYLKGVNLFTPSNYYKVSFTKVNGLNVSAPVTINGFQVGLVSDIKYDYANNSGIIVELGLDKQLRLPIGTEAFVATDMLGTSTITLELGKNNEYYEIGSEIPGKVQNGLMESVSNELMPSVAQLMPKIDSILHNANKLLSNPALTDAVTRLDNISANLESLTSQLNKNVPEIFDNVNAISGDFKTVSNNLSEISTEIKSMPLDSAIMSLNATLTNLQAITTALNSKESSIGLLLNDKGLYNHLDQTILSADSLLKDIKENPKKYINVKVF